MKLSKTKVLSIFLIVFFIGVIFVHVGLTEDMKNMIIGDIIDETNERKQESYFSVNPPKESWNVSFGGSSYDEGYAIQQTSDNGFIITGGTLSFGAGNWDVWLIKTDVNGNEECNTTYGKSGYDKGHSIQQTEEGGYIIGGHTTSYGKGSFDFWLIKTDANGNEEWNRTFGGGNEDRGYSVGQTIDGGYFISGSTASFGAGNLDSYLVKTDANGNEEWNSTFGGSLCDKCLSGQQTTDDGYILTGCTNSFDEDYTGVDVWLIKTDVNGNEEWNITFGGTGVENKFDIAYDVQQTLDGGYILAAETRTVYVSQMDVLLIKTNANGEEEWNRTYGEIYFDSSRSVQQTLDGGYIITGNKEILIGTELNPDLWLIKTDGEGYEEWNNLYGFEEGSGDWGYAVIQTDDGGCIVAGITMPDPYPMRRSQSTCSEKYEGTDLWLIKIGDDGNHTFHIGGLMENWNFISLPVNESINKTRITVYYAGANYSWNDAVSNGYMSDFLFGWNRNSQSYTFTNTLVPGYGYWVYAYNPCDLWVENITINTDNHITELKKNWNVMSVPVNENVSKNDILVNDETWNTAVSNGLISDYLFGWDRMAQSYTFSSTLEPGHAYWLYAYQECQLTKS